MLDEADNLYERVSGGSDKSDNNDYSDRGGKRAIVETVKNTNQPIILIVNNYYNLIKGSGEILKKLCKQIKFYPPYNNQVFSLLKKICNREKINVNNKILQSIADRSGGDIRSAVNDLQSLCLDKDQVDIDSLNVLGYRDRQKIIFDALRDIFKTENIKTIRETLKNLDEDPRSLLFWINENLPKEYIDIKDLSEGYDAVSRADVFLGRTFRRQNYSLWSYASDMMNAGVAVSKSHSYPNERYRFPTWLRQKKSNKNTQVVKNSVTKKFSKSLHASRNKSQDTLRYIKHLFRNDTYFAIKMKKKYDLTEPEIKYLLGDKHSHKLKDILRGSKRIKEQSIEEKTSKKSTEENEDKEEKDEEIQQSLFDF